MVTWTGKADVKGIRRILTETFIVCKGEVGRCLEERLQSLSALLGGEEPVTLLMMLMKQAVLTLSVH